GLSYACNHSFASRTSTHWQDFAAQRREHRDDPLLRTDQDAADAATHREWPSRLWRDGVAHARFHTPFTRAGVFAQRGPRSAPPRSARKSVMQRGQSNCHASSRKHSSQAVRPKKAGAAPGKDGSPMLGQKSTKLPRFGYSRYSPVGPETAALRDFDPAYDRFGS